MLATGGSTLVWTTNIQNAAGALGGLLAGIAAVWGLLFAGPRYRLHYGPTWASRIVYRFWMVDIYLSSRGRRDIKSEAFDDGEPIALDIGVPIRELHGVMWRPKTQRAVPHRVDGSRVLVGPGLIGRHQDLRFVLITDGKPKRLACQASLVDVRVHRGLITPWARTWSLAVLAALVYGFVYNVVYVVVTIVHHRWLAAPWDAILLLGGLLGFAAWVIWHAFASWSPQPPPVAGMGLPFSLWRRAGAGTTPTSSPATPRSTPPDSPEGHPGTPPPQAGSHTDSSSQ